MLSPTELSDQFTGAYAGLLEACNLLSEAEDQSATARRQLADAKAAIVLKFVDPKELGANEAARTAKIDSLCEAEQSEHLRCEANLKTARNLTEQRRLQADHLRYQLRCSELAAGIVNDH